MIPKEQTTPPDSKYVREGVGPTCQALLKIKKRSIQGDRRSKNCEPSLSSSLASLQGTIFVQVCPTCAPQSASRCAQPEPAYPGCPLPGRGPDLVPEGGKRIQVRFQHLLSRGARARCFARRLQRQLVVILNKACNERGVRVVRFQRVAARQDRCSNGSG